MRIINIPEQLDPHKIISCRVFIKIHIKYQSQNSSYISIIGRVRNWRGIPRIWTQNGMILSSSLSIFGYQRWTEIIHSANDQGERWRTESIASSDWNINWTRFAAMIRPTTESTPPNTRILIDHSTKILFSSVNGNNHQRESIDSRCLNAHIRMKSHRFIFNAKSDP